MPFGSGLTLFYQLLAQKIIHINLLEALNLDRQLKFSLLMRID
ncbi:hypothetical protein [Massilibacterium senegalense]